MRAKKLKPLISKPSVFIPIKDRGRMSLKDLKPGMDISTYIPSSNLVFIDYVESTYRVNRFTGHRQLIRRGKFKCKLCGNVFEAEVHMVLRGTTRSCGCMGRYEPVKEGERYGSLVVIDGNVITKIFQYNRKYKQSKRYFKCKCDCGNIVEVEERGLRAGFNISCNKCYNPNIKDSYKPEIYKKCRYLAKRYDKIKSRVRNPDRTDLLVTYGLRGIKLDMDLHDFIRRYYMEDIDFSKLQIDRIDNDKNYTLDNIRWVTPTENASNKTDYKKVSKTDVAFRLLTEFRFEHICKDNGWNKDDFLFIPFGIHSQISGNEFGAHVYKYGVLKPVMMVYHYIRLAKNLSDNMPSEINRVYFKLVDKDGNIVPEYKEWQDDYHVVCMRHKES